MKTLILFHVAMVVLVSCEASVTDTGGLFASRERSFHIYKHHALIGHPFLNQSGTVQFQCIILCLRHKRCLSVNHDGIRGICQLNDGRKEEFPESYQQDDGFSYFDGSSNKAKPLTQETVMTTKTEQETSQAQTTTATNQITTVSTVLSTPIPDTTSAKAACMFNTAPTTPMSFKFIMGPVSMPFKIQFDIKGPQDAVVALAEDDTRASMFAELSLGGYWNTVSEVRACYRKQCPNLLVDHNENILSETEYRPFWVEYDGGVVTVGKGGQIESFLKWDAGAYHGRIPSQVYVGISSDMYVNVSWVFYDFCE